MVSSECVKQPILLLRLTPQGREWFLLFGIFNEVKVKKIHFFPLEVSYVLRLVTEKSLFQLDTKQIAIKLEPQFQCGRADKVVCKSGLLAEECIPFPLAYKLS